MQKQCPNCEGSFEITEDDLAFIERLAPAVGEQKFPIPPPTHCPECRQQRRYGCRNDRNYYPNTCLVCKKALISSYSEEKPFGVLCDACFWGDQWDPLEYGMDYDFSTPFFEQFKQLRETVPRLAIYHTQCENSEYIVHSSRSRNCYMSSSVVDDEEVHYSDLTFVSKNCMDLFSCNKMELCYECVFCDNCFQCEYCESCNDLSDSMMCLDCKGSDYLVGCIGLRNAQHCILNEEATREQCQETVQKLKTDPTFRASFEQQYRELNQRVPHRAAWMISTENCSGNYIWRSKNVHVGFNVRDMEDARYTYEELRHVATCDTTRVGEGEMLYECASIVDAKFSAFCNLTYQCSNLLYCDNCNGTHNCFGSVSLKKHQWCILNKQYTEEEYMALVPKIVEHMRGTGEWGEFFPIGISPFGYNETKAHEWYPMTKEQVLAKKGWLANRSSAFDDSEAPLRQGFGGQPPLSGGWKWSDYEAPVPSVQSVPGERLPYNIADVPDDILNWAIICEESGKPFKLVKRELDFYRLRNLPVPRRCPKQRHYDRVGPTNVRELFDRTCAKCSKAIKTTYSPDRPETVFCEECYLKEVY